MVTLSCAAKRIDGVTLVTGQVTGARRSRRVTVESRLDGPVWPPRRAGVPVAGWDGRTYECVVPAGGRSPVGYASPAAPVDPPMRIVETTPVEAEAVSDEPTADDVVREFASPRPPRDAVPDVTPTPQDHAAETATGTADTAEATGRSGGPRNRDSEAGGAILGDVESRVERAEQLSADPELATATEIVDTLGGIEGVRRLERQLSADAERLERLAGRVAALAERAEAVEIPAAEVERRR